MPRSERRILLIINPCAGMLQAEKAAGGIIRQFCGVGFSVRVHMTSGPGDARRLAEEAGADFDIVACCGGDGTLNEVMSGIAHTECKVPIGYIPCGTTNDLAASLGLPRSVSQAAEVVISGTPYPEDVGLFRDERYFTYVASFGAFTRASYATPQKAKNAIGHLAYILEGAKSINEIKPFAVSVDCDGEKISGDFIFGAVTNSTSIGGLMKLSSDIVDLNDGQFELMLVRNPDRPSEIGKILHEVLYGKYDGDLVALRHGSSISFRSEVPLSWTLDGEYGGSYTETRIENLRGRIRIILPAGRKSV